MEHTASATVTDPGSSTTALSLLSKDASDPDGAENEAAKGLPDSYLLAGHCPYNVPYTPICPHHPGQLQPYSICLVDLMPTDV